MVKINKIILPEYEVFDPNNNSIGFVNEIDILDLRLQIRENNLEGYYIKFNNIIIRIDNEGGLENYPDGFCDIAENYLNKLF